LDVVVPLMEGYYEPLCAIYAKRCIPAIEAQLDRGDYRIFNFFNRVKIKTLNADQIESADPERLSFFNVNTPSALRACQNMINAENPVR
jgi:molybdopterin-guanine dinucleotide biosynthesis protein A